MERKGVEHWLDVLEHSSKMRETYGNEPAIYSLYSKSIKVAKENILSEFDKRIKG